MRKKRKPLLLKIILFVVVAVLIVGSVHVAEAIIHRETIEKNTLDYVNPKISESLDGFKIAFVTDIHISNQADTDRLNRAIALIEQEQPDLLLLGGDFSYSNKKKAQTAYQLLSQVDVPYGIYAVLGNHDLGKSDIEAMKNLGINCLNNSGKQIVQGLYIGGVQDLWKGKPDVQRAIAKRDESDFVIVLSHNPDVVRDSDVTGVDLMLSGHTHGGLANVFGFWSPAMNVVSKYENRFAKGLVHDATDVFISNGLGDTTYPRVFAMRQVNFITLRR